MSAARVSGLALLAGAAVALAPQLAAGQNTAVFTEPQWNDDLGRSADTLHSVYACGYRGIGNPGPGQPCDPVTLKQHADFYCQNPNIDGYRRLPDSRVEFRQSVPSGTTIRVSPEFESWAGQRPDTTESIDLVGRTFREGLSRDVIQVFSQITCTGRPGGGLEVTARVNGTRNFPIPQNNARGWHLVRMGVKGRVVLTSELTDRQRASLLRGRMVVVPKSQTEATGGTFTFNMLFRFCRDRACARSTTERRMAVMRAASRSDAFPNRYALRVQQRRGRSPRWWARFRGNLDLERTNLPRTGLFNCPDTSGANIALRRWKSNRGTRTLDTFTANVCSFPRRQLFNSGLRPNSPGAALQSFTIRVSGKVA